LRRTKSFENEINLFKSIDSTNTFALKKGKAGVERQNFYI